MSAEKMIKTEAKRALSGNWAAAVTILFVSAMVPILSILIVAAAYTIVGEGEVEELLAENTVGTVVFVALNVAAVAALLLLLPILSGFVRFFGKLASGEKAEVFDIFHFTESHALYKKAAAFMAGVAMKCAGILIVCTLPALLVYSGADEDETATMLAIILAVIGLVLALIWMHRFAFSVVMFSYMDYDRISAQKTGKAVAKGNTGKLLKLTFSFIPLLLSLFFVVPFIYVIPYLSCAYVVSLKYIINDYFERNNNAGVDTSPVPVPQMQSEQLNAASPTVFNPFESAPSAAVTLEKTADVPSNTGNTEIITEENTAQTAVAEQ